MELLVSGQLGGHRTDFSFEFHLFFRPYDEDAFSNGLAESERRRPTKAVKDKMPESRLPKFARKTMEKDFRRQWNILVFDRLF